MLDIKFIRENAKKIEEAAKNKNIELDVSELLKIEEKKRKIQKEIDDLRSQRKKITEKIQKVSASEQRNVVGEGKEIKEKISSLEEEFKETKKKFDDLMARVPMIPSPDTPIGRNSDDNPEVFHWGEIPDFKFTPKNHIEIGKSLDILDLERGAKVGGYRGYYLKNEGVLLVMGLMNWALLKMVEKGFKPMVPPTLVKGFALFGTGYFKGLEYDPQVDEIYQIASSDKEIDGKASKEKKFLVGTAEPSLLAYYAEETLEEEQLPLRLCGFSQCYRSEIGSYGKDTKGIYRVHEFMKIEQVIISKADIEKANELQEEMIKISEELHQELGLPYRKVQICTGDMSAGKYRAFDLEAWMPGLNRWGETGSASNFLDWQSRRLNVKYKDISGEKKYVYMLNNTALATPRTFIAILENYQQADGSVVVPEVLRKYVGKDAIKPK